MVLRKAVEDGFTHFYRKCGQTGRHGLFPPETAILRSFHNFAQWLNLALLPTKQPKILGQCIGPNPNKQLWLQLYP